MPSSKHIKAAKPAIVTKHQIHKKDTGSPEVQVAILTEEITKLTDHLKSNNKDHSSRRGLLRKVGKRKKILNYLLGEDRTRYIRTCKKNGIRPNLLLANQTASAGDAMMVVTEEEIVDSL